ncbi:MAG: TonB-dependent receptor, partial [Flavitalea sp.]
NTSALGATHSIALGNNTNLKSSAAISYTRNDYNELFTGDEGKVLNTYRNNFKTRKWIFSSTANQKINARTSLRTGVIANLIGYDYYQKSRENPGDPVLVRINTSNNTSTLQAFTQVQYKATRKLTFQAGLHYLQLLLNHSHSLEPRASVKFELNNRNSIALGYGMHSQIQGLGVYFAKTNNAEGQSVLPNKNLSFTKSAHYVFSFAHAFNPTLRLKTELYYQALSDVPVSIYDSLSFSTLNIRGDYITEALVNKGTGRNYGIDISLEKHLSRNLYFILNQSFYQSKYKASDGIERDTRFNGQYLTNFTGGKDFPLRDGKRTLGIHVKMINAGGFRTTPINIAGSMEKGYTVYKEKEAFTLQNATYFRTDIRVSMKWNRKKLTSTLSLDIQNVSNRKNIYDQRFDAFKGEVVNNYQTGLIPILNYKIDF